MTAASAIDAASISVASASAQPPRESVRFASGSDVCDAWLYRPVGAQAGKHLPIVVMAHGLGGIKAMRLDAFAERFRAAGYICLVFDYRHFGDSSGEPRQFLNIPRQLADWRAAVAYARTLPGVDPERVVIWGTSFGGGHAIVTAAEDARVVAAISQCPFTDGLSSALALGPLTCLKLGIPGFLDLLAGVFGLPPVRMSGIGKPGEPALMNAPDAMAGYYALLEASNLTELPTRAPARIALQIPLYTPGRKTRQVRCPILFAVSMKDSVAPAKATLRHAARAPRGEIRRYDAGHFDIYIGADFERNVADQVAFLQTHVPPEPR